MAKSKIDLWLEEMERQAAAPTAAIPRIATDKTAAKAAPLTSAPVIASSPTIAAATGGDTQPAAATLSTVGFGAPIATTDGDSLTSLWSPEKKPATARRSVEDLLLERKQVEPDKLQQARTVQSNARSRKIAHILLEMGAVREEDLQRAVATHVSLPFAEIDARKLDRRAFELLPADLMKSRGCCGVRLHEGKLTLGLVNPADVFLIDELKIRFGTIRIEKTVVVCQSQINAAIEAGNAVAQQGDQFDEIIRDMDNEELEIVEDEKEEVTDLAKASGESPVIRLVNFLIFDAIKQGASDIHMEPHERRFVIRYRIDGILFEAMSPPYQMQAAVVSRLKIMANLDISERRLPQDGRIRTMVHGRHVDLRVSTVPTQYGEKTVIRILDNRSITLGLEQLGFSEDMLTILQKQIDRPNGIILVTGPTGSGKTTTLYSCLRCMDGSRMNISTVEDPVEYHLNFANQIQVNDKIGMTFSAALRSLLRQDPDVIMMGEIRDAETANIAVQASLTGHLVLSTLHTNDAPSSVTRLINIGVEPYLISASVNAVLAQRLVRRICADCKEPFISEDDEMNEFLTVHGFNPNSIFKGKGCERCRNTGYKGRVGIYELLVLDDVARDLVVRNPNVTELRRICKERGMISLREDGLQKVAAGQTTIEEVLSATENTL